MPPTCSESLDFFGEIPPSGPKIKRIFWLASWPAFLGQSSLLSCLGTFFIAIKILSKAASWARKSAFFIKESDVWQAVAPRLLCHAPWVIFFSNFQPFGQFLAVPFDHRPVCWINQIPAAPNSTCLLGPEVQLIPLWKARSVWFATGSSTSSLIWTISAAVGCWTLRVRAFNPVLKDQDNFISLNQGAWPKTYVADVLIGDGVAQLCLYKKYCALAPSHRISSVFLKHRHSSPWIMWVSRRKACGLSWCTDHIPFFRDNARRDQITLMMTSR